VPCVLEGAHALEGDRPPDVDVGRGDVDAELHPQRPAERQLALEAALRQHMNRVPGQVGAIRHRAILEARRAVIRRAPD
jgi:hypothetical protein